MGNAVLLPGVLSLALMLAACSKNTSNPAPPRLTEPAVIPVQESAISVPITAPLAELQRFANAEVPMTLATIDEQKSDCVKVKVIGKISCRIIGKVTRGAIRVGGKGDVLTLTMPVSATVSAKQIGHVLNETATAAAIVTASVKLASVGDWKPVAKVELEYVWTKKPGVDLLGQRITFANRADPALAKLIARLEADIPRQIEKLQPRAKLEQAWQRGFTTVSLNRKNPPVWLRIAPQQLRFRHYSVDNGLLTLTLAVTAQTETFIGDRPDDPVATPLPQPAPYQIAPANGFRFHLPVIADYTEIEPVLERALDKLAKKPLELPGIGPVHPRFEKVTMFATTGGRLAIGLTMKVATPGKWIDARGTVWLTGQPYNEPGSQLVKVRDLHIEGQPNSPSFGLLLAVVESPSISRALGGALSQNFARDYQEVVGKAGDALTKKRLGDFVLSARIDDVKNGIVFPVGQGLYMPVDAQGTATLTLDPEPKREN